MVSAIPMQALRTPGSLRPSPRSTAQLLLVEQHVEDALEMSNRGYVIESGQLVKADSGRELLEDPDIHRAYMGL